MGSSEGEGELVDHDPTRGESPAEPEEAAQEPHVAAALRRLAELDERPVDKHPAVYADIDETLRAALGASSPSEQSG